MSVLAVEGLNVAYGGIAALHDASLSIGDGEIVTVIGPNGAGKTTLLNAIMGVHPGRGPVRFGGRDMARLPIEERVRAGIGLVPEKRELFSSLSVEDNLRLGFFRHRAQGRAPGREPEPGRERPHRRGRATAWAPERAREQGSGRGRGQEKVPRS